MTPQPEPDSSCRLIRKLLAIVLGAVVLTPLHSPADDSVPSKPEVVVGVAEPLGTRGISINGTVHPHGAPTGWTIEYGLTAAYGSQTEMRMLPPRIAAYYAESWDYGHAGWQTGMSGGGIHHEPAGGASKGFIRYSEPSGDDPNHIDGIGTLHLCKYMYPGPMKGALNESLFLGGGDADFRDARVSISVRGVDWRPNGSELVWWTQSQSNIAELTGPGWRRANWAYTGFSLTPLLASGRWEKAEYRLKNDSTQWTYGGNNLAQKRPNYDYWPIDLSQQHLNIDFFHLLTFVNPQNRPSGAIDFDELVVAYRNYSLLLPSNGGRLASSPAGGEDASRLTDGWRHGENRMWKSAANPKSPQEFVWTFANPVTIETIQIHQHTSAPSKSVEILVSDDGRTFAPLATLDLPEKSPLGPNFAFALAKPKKTTAAALKLVIKSGYKPDAWGLGEVEVFGEGATMLPESEPNHVTADLTGLEARKTYHYRIVAASTAGKTFSPDRTFALPATTKPHVVTGTASRITPTSARLEGRLNPMGKRTQFHFEIRSEGTPTKTPETYGGLQITPRAAYSEVKDLKPGTTYSYRLVAVNEDGRTEGEEATFRTE